MAHALAAYPARVEKVTALRQNGVVLAMLALTLALEAPSFTAKIDARLWDEPAGVYRLGIRNNGTRLTEPAFAWDMGVWLSALARAIAVSPKEHPRWDRAYRAMEAYWAPKGGVSGYAVWPGQQSNPDRFYDDNAWLGLAILEAYETTKDPTHLQRARDILEFIKSGEDDKLGGGLYWHERDKASKNTCTNAPAIVLALELHKATKQRVYRADAERWMAWMKRLQDTDGLYFDNIKLNGEIERTKWTYNTALMIRANLRFYGLTRRSAYRTEAIRVAEAARKHWVTPEGAIRDEASFAHHLAEAFWEVGGLRGQGKFREIARKAVAQAQRFPGPEGFYALRWDRYEPREDRMILLYQASIARALWVIGP